MSNSSARRDEEKKKKKKKVYIRDLTSQFIPHSLVLVVAGNKME